jgi:hypothetical protein
MQILAFTIYINYIPRFTFLNYSRARSIDVTSDGEVVVCDWKKKRLLFLNSDGYIYGEYRGSTEHPLVEPIGTTLEEQHLLNL